MSYRPWRLQTRKEQTRLNTRTFQNITIIEHVSSLQKKLRTLKHIKSAILFLSGSIILLAIPFNPTRLQYDIVFATAMALFTAALAMQEFISRHQPTQAIASFASQLPNIKNMELQPCSMLQIVYMDNHMETIPLRQLFRCINVKNEQIYHTIKHQDVTWMRITCYYDHIDIELQHQERVQKHQQLYKLAQNLKPKHLNVPILAIDFDGTLAHGHYPETTDPDQELIQTLIELQKKGCKLILWTCRTGKYLANAIQLCEAEGLTFDAVNENLPEILEKYQGDNRKITADLYIDDASFPW